MLLLSSYETRLFKPTSGSSSPPAISITQRQHELHTTALRGTVSSMLYKGCSCTFLDRGKVLAFIFMYVFVMIGILSVVADKVKQLIYFGRGKRCRLLFILMGAVTDFVYIPQQIREPEFIAP